MHKRISRGRSREIPTSHHLFLDAGGASCEPIQQKHHRRSAQIFARLRFGARHARAFRFPAGGNQRAANEARDVASLWKRRGLTSILKRRVSPLPPRPLLRRPCFPLLSAPPSLLLLLPGVRRSTSACSIQSSKLDEALAPIPEVGERR